MSAWLQREHQRLLARAADGLMRQRPLLTSPPGALTQVNGVMVLNFASNDYLGLAADDRLLVDAGQLHGNAARLGSTASHVLSGHHLPHHLLEDELADWLGVERALVFSSGYLANLAVQTALLRSGDRVLHDKLNHASLLDGARLSPAMFRRYAHADAGALARRLSQPADGLTMVVSDGVFSMDGDVAPLEALHELTRAQQALLVVDEAHAFGVMGADGRGSVAAAGLSPWPELLRVGTLGKAFGSSGAFIAGSGVLIEAIAQYGRSYVYTTAQAPWQASISRAALRHLASEQGDVLRARLAELIMRFREGASQLGLSLLPSMTPIQPVVLGDNDRAWRWQQQLWQRGIWVPAIRPPTVPAGQARLRISLSAVHAPAQVDALLDALAACQRSEGVGS